MNKNCGHALDRARVCLFVLFYGFPSVLGLIGPIGTPHYHTNHRALLLGALSQLYVVFMGINPWARTSYSTVMTIRTALQYLSEDVVSHRATIEM